MNNALIKIYTPHLTELMPAAIPCIGAVNGGIVANFADVVKWVEGSKIAVELLCAMGLNNDVSLQSIDSFDLLYDLTSDNDELDFIAHDLYSLDFDDGHVYSFGEVANYLDECFNHERVGDDAIQCATNILHGILKGTVEVKSL